MIGAAVSGPDPRRAVADVASRFGGQYDYADGAEAQDCRRTNVTVPAYLALRERGYRVRRESGESEETWIAENKGIKLIANDIVALLGLAAVAESRGADWKASDGEIDDFLQRFPH
jgi:hypothetical protein